MVEILPLKIRTNLHSQLSLPANNAVDVIIGCAAILVDITPGARVPAAIVGKATRPAVPTRDVITVLPAMVIAGTENKQTNKKQC